MLDSIAALVMVMLNELEETDLVLDLVCLHNLLGAFLPPDVKTMGYQIQLKETIGFALNTIFWIYAITAWIQINNLIFITNNY